MKNDALAKREFPIGGGIIQLAVIIFSQKLHFTFDKMTGLQYREESQAQCIDDELQTFIKHFREPFSNTTPLLIFPTQLGTIITKCIRYHAAIYGLASFYVTMSGKIFLVLCQYCDLKSNYQTVYNEQRYYSREDSEVINPFKLYTGITASIHSLLSRRKRCTFGFDIQDDTTSTAGSPSTRNQFSAIFRSKRDQSETNQVDDYVNTNLAHRPCPSFENLTVTEPIIDTFSEESRSENYNSLGDSVLNTSTDGASFLANKLDALTLETKIPIFEFEENFSDYRKQFLEYKSFMDQILERVSHCPILIQARNNYERFKYIKDNGLNTVVELYDIPSTYRTVSILKFYNYRPSCVKWCDETHALLIFLRKNHADKALALNHHLIKTRPMIDASPIGTVVGCMMNFSKIFKHLESKEKSYRK